MARQVQRKTEAQKALANLGEDTTFDFTGTTDQFKIEHHDWAYLASSGVFIPTRYTVTIETDAGVLKVGANVVSAFAASRIRDVSDSPHDHS